MSSQEELNVEGIAKPQLNRYSQYQSQASMYFSANNLMANETENRSLDYSEHSLNQEQIDQISDVTKIPDFVLVYKPNDDNDDKVGKRKHYQQKLLEAGLILTELPSIDKSHDQIYIYATPEALFEKAEFLKMRKNINEKFLNQQQRNKNQKQSCSRREERDVLENVTYFFKKYMPCIIVDRDVIRQTQKHHLTAEFTEDKKYLFNIDESDIIKQRDFFTPSERSVIVHYILETADDEEDENAQTNEHDDETDQMEKDKKHREYYGLQKLISDNVYTDAYPLHDEVMKKNLLQEWATLKKAYKLQPLDYIKDYFGVKIALYFAWLNFYTNMLIPVAIFGITCMIIGWIALETDPLKKDICDPNMDLTMCPQCDKDCDYWHLNDACFYSKFSTIFDNYITTFFAIGMSVWSSIYLSLWKHYSAKLIHRWGLSGLRTEKFAPRPEYLRKVQKLRDNNKIKGKLIHCNITDREEYKVPWTYKTPIFIFSKACLLFWLALLMITVTALLVFKTSVITSEIIFPMPGDRYYQYFEEWRTLIIPAIAAVIDLIFIKCLNFFYQKMALWLTKKELHRTQSEFDNSFTIKIFLFQFINYYSAFFYIAFVKGRFVGNPSAYTRVFNNHRLEECSPGGCLMELCIQLSIVMVGDQLLGQIEEYFIPFLLKIWKKWRTDKNQGNKRGNTQKDVELNQDTNQEELNNQEIIANTFEKNEQNDNDVNSEVEIRENNGARNKGKYKSKRYTQYKHGEYVNRDHELIEWDSRGLFDEYLEMVIQYGFVTLFVTAFPLAPLFALLNNIVEVRYDAKKFLNNYRRPVSQTVKSIGVWLKIIDSIGKLAVVTNAFIIAFTSNFIPRVLFKYFYRDENNTSFLMWSLSKFNTEDFNGTAPMHTKYPNITECWYPAFRNGPNEDHKYALSSTFWIVLSARIGFVICYNYVVILFKLLVKHFIPSVSKKLKTQIMKEQWNLCRIITEHQRKQKKANNNNNNNNRSNSKENIISDFNNTSMENLVASDSKYSKDFTENIEEQFLSHHP